MFLFTISGNCGSRAGSWGAQSELLLFPTKSLLQPPELATGGSDFEIQSVLVIEPVTLSVGLGLWNLRIRKCFYGGILRNLVGYAPHAPRFYWMQVDRYGSVVHKKPSKNWALWTSLDCVGFLFGGGGGT